MKRIKSSCSMFLFLVIVSSTAIGFAMSKPISAARDYDGTYSGAPGTGSIGYSVLFRDNEDNGATSGCEGEGCGKHPGVDIIATSGTNVLAAISGTVIRSECDDASGWGGIIVVQSTSPYDSTTIYTTYAHMKQRNYSFGQAVSEGTVLGLSGGAPADVCHGNSTGSHLHFQIDKANTSWFPTGRVSQPDSNFEVVQHNYNPMLYVTGKYNWTFDQAGFSEYWIAYNIASSGVGSGSYWIDGNADPNVRRDSTIACGMAKPCSGQVAIEANLYKYVYVGLQNTCVSNPVKIYFKTSSSDVWDETKVVSFNYVNPATYMVYMGGNSSWTGIVKAVRIDPAVNCNPSASDPDYFSQIAVGR